VFVKLPVMLREAPDDDPEPEKRPLVRKSLLLLVPWAGEQAPLREKMQLASAMPQLRRRIMAIDLEVQATDYAEISAADVLDHVRRKHSPHASLDI